MNAFLRFLDGLASNLHPASDGVHHHPGTAGPYPCADPDCARR